MDTDALKQTFFNGNPIRDYAETPDKLISLILPNAFIFAGFILFIYLVFGGFMMISSAGDSKKAADGQQAITNAIIGFVLIFTSYWIIQIIEIITGIPIV